MTKIEKKIGVLGAGNMGEAFVGALVRSKVSEPAMIAISDVRKERLDFMHATYGVMPFADNFKLFNDCAVVILAVKPQQTDEVLQQIAGHSGYGIAARKLFISIAAGIPIRKLEALLYSPLDEGMRIKLPIIRVMPNTPALVLAGMSGMSANANATPEDLETTRTILGALGKVMAFKEADLDAVTALSGSGPAYVFYFIESMIAGGLAAGLEPHAAETLTLQTLKGALKLLRERKEPPEELRRKVTSPGGTTEAALKVMEAQQVKQNIVAAIVAAARRSQELSR
ncbi:MAG: pyrroline-5-carboxylate reductase [Desulfobacterales bacterium]|nr:pyrroline-5-carboxylate reductase [Desulfobacterales bacterium]